jgi:hypothetical protein
MHRPRANPSSPGRYLPGDRPLALEGPQASVGVDEHGPDPSSPASRSQRYRWVLGPLSSWEKLVPAFVGRVIVGDR